MKLKSQPMVLYAIYLAAYSVNDDDEFPSLENADKEEGHEVLVTYALGRRDARAVADPMTAREVINEVIQHVGSDRAFFAESA